MLLLLTTRRILAWPLGSLALIGLGLVILALPASFEGPALVPISPGHALSLVDMIGLLPLLVGMSWLNGGVWQRRGRVANWIGEQPAHGAALMFGGGFGLGLLLSSAFSTFFSWWAIGALLFGMVNIAIVRVAVRHVAR